MKERILWILAALLFNVCAFADDDVRTTFSTKWVESPKLNEKASLYEVRLTPFFTYVTIKKAPTKNKKRQNYWTSPRTYIVSGNAKLPLLGALGDNNSYHRCTYDDGWGWNNVKKDQELYYTLIFSGRIPEGQTQFSLIDEATDGRGYTFSNWTINNPKQSGIMDELSCRNNADENNDGICGVYEEIGGSKYRIACVKIYGSYFLIYLGCSDRITWWFAGDLKAWLEESATRGTFKAKWVMKDKTTQGDAFVTFDGRSMKSFIPNGDPSESTYIKMYPNGSSSSENGAGLSSAGGAQWTGTGFSLMNNYVVTNYHVVENAKSIIIHGVNGNFTKEYKATVIATDKFNDLAILLINGANISNSEIPYSVKTTTSDVGEDVFVLGYPLTSTMGDEIKLTTGVISSKTGFQGDVSIYQISAPIQPGNSGGPLFDSKGNVIGIVSAKHTGAENVSYAIKTSYLRNLMESAISTNILPQNNKLAGQNLSSQVKSLKKYVYYITCSNIGSEASAYNSPSHISSSSNSSEKTYNYPSVNNNIARTLKVVSVSIQDNQTVLTFSCNNKAEDGSYYEWVTLEKNAYIVANGQKYTLKRTEGIGISPEKTYYAYAGETKTFKMYFPAIPKNTTSIDFIESEDSPWRLYGIQLK